MQEQGLKFTSTCRIRDSVLVWYSRAVCANEMGTEKAFLHRRDSKNDVVFDVNVRMVVLVQKLERGYAALKKISKVLGILGHLHF